MERERPRGNRKRRKVCAFCVDKVEYIDYKDIAKLRKYMSDRAKILPSVRPAPAPSTSGLSRRPSSAPAR